MNAIRKVIIPVRMEDGTDSGMTLFARDPDSHPDSPVILCMPAMGVPADYYEPLALVGAEKGLHMITADLRGIGLSSVRASRRTQFGYRELIRYDLPAFVSSARARFPRNPILLLGHSLGGQLGALYASANPGKIAGLILVASGSVYFRGWTFPSNVGLIISSQFIRVVAEIFGYLPGKRLGFGGTESRQLIRDWSRQALSGRYDSLGDSVDYEALLSEVRTPILAISFARDFFAPYKAVRNLYAKMSMAPTTHHHCSAADLGLRDNQLDHFQWAKNPEPIVSIISRWISRTPFP
ncbi:MAG: alpha/beta fold hydrolase [Desulfomonilaceae bacterium]|nr:alpha/beta fold hydrolase [Desulfomonilaceae bacterium]